MIIPAEAEVIIEQQRQRYYRDDAVRWVWILYGLAQATITMLIAFDVITTLTPAEVTTAIALIVYVGVNEVFVRPYRTGGRVRGKEPIEEPVTDLQEES